MEDEFLGLGVINGQWLPSGGNSHVPLPGDMLVAWRVSVITDLLFEGLMTESVAKAFPLTACPMVAGIDGVC